jgi:uncharacterized caspase-like protein
VAGGGIGGAGAPASADDLLIVDCLLPPEIRQLGTQITYLAARKAVKAPAFECQRQGGEYTAAGNASQASALEVWLPLAQAGDPEAQNYVGEVYEKGIGLSPDFAAAAVWYQRAAEQGYGPAQINLGQLYETGRGVPRDVQLARALFRRASGLEDAGLDFVAAASDDVAERELRAALEGRDREIARLEREVQRERARRSQEVRRLEGELEEALSSEQARRGTELEALRAELERRSREASRTSAEEIARLQRDLEAGERAAAEQRREAERLRADLQRARASLEEIEQRAAPPPELPGPTIQVIEPPLVSRTRGVRVVGSTPSPAAARTSDVVVGRVDAPGGLLSLVVNGQEVTPNERGIFKAKLPSQSDDLRVEIVALDEQGKRGLREFLVPGAEPAVPAPSPSRVRSTPAVDFGRFHALVIGNDAYRSLPDLKSAGNDARALADLLRERYGFEVTLLLDADRYGILSQLNELRGRLSERDNLLIYYAGHGELDEANQRGHWLPVDAESGSSANWISNVAVTDILNAMSARHVLVISDSCYSGSLTRSALARLDPGMSDEARVAWQRAMAGKRSRTALTSGGIAPVMDAGGGRHSVFAGALLSVLRANEAVLEGQRLFQELAARVTYAAERFRFEQTPQYAPIKFSGHESGDFFFVPKS